MTTLCDLLAEVDRRARIKGSPPSSRMSSAYSRARYSRHSTCEHGVERVDNDGEDEVDDDDDDDHDDDHDDDDVVDDDNDDDDDDNDNDDNDDEEVNDDDG